MVRVQLARLPAPVLHCLPVGRGEEAEGGEEEVIPNVLPAGEVPDEDRRCCADCRWPSRQWFGGGLRSQG